ncbi:MAG: hypothetical protein HON78_02295 [Legionellales bacterium]|jgi:hypothetical protein|nr:hypothetical protein [Legionellales bacterium]
MKDVNCFKDLKYYITMFRRSVFILCIMATICVFLVFFLLYAYAAQPDRKFYASASMYKVTEIYPTEN